MSIFFRKKIHFKDAVLDASYQQLVTDGGAPGMGAFLWGKVTRLLAGKLKPNTKGVHCEVESEGRSVCWRTAEKARGGRHSR